MWWKRSNTDDHPFLYNKAGTVMLPQKLEVVRGTMLTPSLHVTSGSESNGNANINITA